MKTFETEKHNIPEGATHYLDETYDKFFYWGMRYDGRFKLMDTNSKEWLDVNSETFNLNCKPIPQTKEVEWVNGLPPVGVECEYFHKPRNLWVKFIPLLITDSGSSPNNIPAIYGEWYHPSDCMWEPDLIDLMDNPKFRKPETEAERVERERLEWIEKWGTKIKNIGTMTYKDILGEMHDSLK